VDIKRFIIGTVVGAITIYILGYLIFDLAFGEFYPANAGSATGLVRDPQLMWAPALGSISYAALLTLAIGTRGDSVTIVDGIKTAAIVGFLLWFTVDFIFYGNFNMSNLTIAVVDPLLELVRAGIGGAVITAVLGKISGAQEEPQTSAEEDQQTE
jgi:hypothetical protein